MRKLKSLFSVFLCVGLLAGCDQGQNTYGADHYTIGIAQIVDHASLNTIREAIIEELEELGYADGKNITIDYQNAANQISNLDTIMTNFVSEGADAIIAIATPTAQSAQNHSESTPVIFSAVSDPVEAGLVDSLEVPGGNITGTSDEVQVDQIIDLILHLTPQAKKVGVLYNTGEINSVSNSKRFKEYAQFKGLKVVEKSGKDLTTMQEAAESLCQEVDVLYSPNDNTVASGMSALSHIAIQAGVPYYVGADSMVQDGGFATCGINYTELGKETARMTVEVLEGRSPSTMPIKVFKDDLDVYINEKTLIALQAYSKVPVSLSTEVKESDTTIVIGQ